MDSLRERIDQEVYEAYQAGVDHNQVPFKYPAMGKSEIQEATERIVAAFEAALLSDEVVEAAAIEIHAEGWNGGEEWADAHPVKQDNYKQQARAALQAALAAAKGTEGEQAA